MRLRNGEELRAKTVVSNATRWDTFGRLVDPQHVPASERSFLGRYRKSPSFTTLHLGVRAEALPWLADCECHHILLEDWAELEDTVSAKGAGTLFVSIPSVLDPTVAPEAYAAIADVAAYVTPGSALDQEARTRGNSTYFPDRVVPMLPDQVASTTPSVSSCR